MNICGADRNPFPIYIVELFVRVPAEMVFHLSSIIQVEF